ncbi:Oxaloacetate decarboxylase involved in citrate fermentation [Fructilactobacillus florum 8D]|uniref:Oxaloacetate decarboxylase involved in citrate fermentation n=1 Tax=Fructilactobacillus florum 8D TaxID=1221538 RepID=W9ELI1_9LACO|nr:NADP-dependent malic enzyme [Fructilactobacillus florum]ETO40529.1 Oxaloacetate decarboxylase involved in citrate fermentation [Fructilactobacillus florum 8D]
MTDDVFEIHKKHTGILGIEGDFPVENKEELGLAYTPGVAQVAKAIQKDPKLKDVYTMSGKLVAVVTDGTAVLGLGNIGPGAGLPIVEGKALLYKDLAQVDAVPLALEPEDATTMAHHLQAIAPSFAGFHLEDIAAPKCFELEEELRKLVDIPVYHDDQEGTAIVILAGLINAARVVQKPLSELKVVLNGVGASGVATARLLDAVGLKRLTLVDVDGVVHPDSQNYNHYQTDLAQNFQGVAGETLDDVIADQDVFIGLSVANVLSPQQVQRMAAQPIIFALANPVPEIDPEEARAAGATVVATGSSKYPNQVNNILAFPGLYRGLLQSGIKSVTPAMEATVAKALAGMIATPTAQTIVPGVFDAGVVQTVSQAVMELENNTEK